MSAAAGSPVSPVVSTGAGAVRGSASDGIVRYLGIPYAAAPVGENRFELPRPHPGWEGVRDATEYGPTAPQAPYTGGIETVLPSVIIDGDEYLNVNVWAPEGATGLPVMVWVHGGALSRGSNSLDGYDGSTFARDGVVFVSLNYRLGAEGFSVLRDAELNLGLADVFAALRWVQSEIARFGGDPDQVTIFGQSAGGNLIAALLAHRDARTLVARAIIQSGPLTARPAKAAGRITRLMAKDLGIRPTKAAFAAISPAELVASQLRVTAGSTPITGGPGFALAIGGHFIPSNPEPDLAQGDADDIGLIIGATTEEYRLWFVPTGLMTTITPLFLRLARLKFSVSRRIFAPYRANRPHAGTGELLGVLATDILLRLPLNRLADDRLSRRTATWVYEFAWRSPVQDLGAAHAVELGFVFDALAAADSIGIAGSSAPQSLATEMHDAWVRFATTGDPGWQAWDERRPVRMFGGAASIVYAPREDERVTWSNPATRER